MTIAGPIIILFCGAAVLAGVYLPWMSELGIGLSGWDLADSSQYFGGALPEVYLVLGCGISMVICALVALIVSATTEGAATKREQASLLTLGIIVTLTAFTALGGAAWFGIHLLREGYASNISYGVCVSAGTAALGLVFGILTILTTSFSKGWKARR